MARLVQWLLLALAGSGASLRAPAHAAQGKLFFLMLGDGSIEQEDIWARYFSKAERGVAFEAFLHCERYEACKKSVRRQDLFTIVPWVNSTYCFDLVSPMLALLRAAAERSDGNPYDKFVFVSHNSVPIKSFRTAQRTLLEGQQNTSFFQVSPMPGCNHMKASQWFALSNWHAARMLHAAKTSKPHWNLSDPLCVACLDENWPIVSVFGAEALQKPALPQGLHSQTIMWLEWGPKIVGKSKRGSGRGPYGPSYLQSISPEFMQSLRSRKELFLRKVGSNTTFCPNCTGSTMSLPDAFDAFLLNS